MSSSSPVPARHRPRSGSLASAASHGSIAGRLGLGELGESSRSVAGLIALIDVPHHHGAHASGPPASPRHYSPRRPTEETRLLSSPPGSPLSPMSSPVTGRAAAKAVGAVAEEEDEEENGAEGGGGGGGGGSGGNGPPPPLAAWIGPALSCACAYAFYNIFIKKGSATINPILGGVVLQFVAALLGTALLASLVAGGGEAFQLQFDYDGLYWSVLAGLAVGLAEMLSFVVSGSGVPATQSIPVIIGGSVLFGAVQGLLALGERLVVRGRSGVGLPVAGIALVASDPGEKVEEGGGKVLVSAVAGPPLYWIAVALICASAYAFYNIFIKKGSASIDPILGGVILQFVAAIFGSTLLAAIAIKDHGMAGLAYDRAGLIWSCLAGVAVGTAELISFTVSGMGVNATQSIPIIIGGSVLFGAVLGLIMLGETMMWQGWLGVALLTAGIGFVATDPGEKVVGHHRLILHERQKYKLQPNKKDQTTYV